MKVIEYSEESVSDAARVGAGQPVLIVLDDGSRWRFVRDGAAPNAFDVGSEVHPAYGAIWDDAEPRARGAWPAS